jgi:hypothetical protein
LNLCQNVGYQICSYQYDKAHTMHIHVRRDCSCYRWHQIIPVVSFMKCCIISEMVNVRLFNIDEKNNRHVITNIRFSSHRLEIEHGIGKRTFRGTSVCVNYVFIEQLEMNFISYCNATYITTIESSIFHIRIEQGQIWLNSLNDIIFIRSVWRNKDSLKCKLDN